MFRDGSFLQIGWPSITVFSSSDYKRVALTDYDRFPEDIDGEGDGFSLASKRTTTFMSAGMTLAESSSGREITDVKWRRSSPHEAPPTTGILSLYNRGRSPSVVLALSTLRRLVPASDGKHGGVWGRYRPKPRWTVRH